MYVSGYFMSFANTRAAVNRLQIPDKGVEDDRLEFPINDWLAKQGRQQPLAGAVDNPDCELELDHEVNGMLFMTWFHPYYESKPEPEERQGDKAIKDWLIDEAGVKEEDLTWYTCWDDYGLTRNGLVPYPNDMQGPRKPRVYLSGDQLRRWLKSKKDVEDFIEQDLLPAGEEVNMKY